MMIPHQPEQNTMHPSRLKRTAFLMASVTAIVLIGGAFLANQITSAQNRWTTQPRVETTYAEIRDGDTIRRVPQQRMVYESQVANTFTQRLNSAARSKPLPHDREIGSLVQNILGKSNRFALANLESVQTSSVSKEEQKKQLESMLEDQFDAMHADQQAQMDQLAGRLESLKEQHQARADAREEIIRRRMNELLRQPDPLAWNPRAEQRLNVDTLPLGISKSTSSATRPSVDLQQPTPPNVPGSRSERRVFQQRLEQPKESSSSTPKERPPLPPQPPQFDGFAQIVQGNSSDEPNLPPPLMAPPSPPQSPLTRAVGEAAIKKAIDDVYAAIGRSSVDQSEKASDQLQKSVKVAQKTIEDASTWPQFKIGGQSKASIEKRIGELREVLRAAAKTMGKSEYPDSTEPAVESEAPRLETGSDESSESSVELQRM